MTQIETIKAHIRAAGADGLAVAQMAKLINRTPVRVHDVLRESGRDLFKHGNCKHVRYFLTQEHAAAYAVRLVAVLAQSAAERKERERLRSARRNAERCLLRAEQPKKPRKKPERKTVAKVSPWRQETPTRRNTTHQPKRPVEIINPGVQIQRIPCSNDYRFSVSPHFKGEFSREWQEKRA